MCERENEKNHHPTATTQVIGLVVGRIISSLKLISS